MLNEKDSNKLTLRLKKIEGQVRGVESMIGDGRYCIDILNQTRAIRSGIKRVEDFILENHMKTCVADSFLSKDTEEQDKKILEVIALISKYR